MGNKSYSINQIKIVEKVILVKIKEINFFSCAIKHLDYSHKCHHKSMNELTN